MNIEIVFKKIGFAFNFGKKSVHHIQVYKFSMEKMYFNEQGKIEFAKQLLAF